MQQKLYQKYILRKKNISTQLVKNIIQETLDYLQSVLNNNQQANTEIVNKYLNRKISVVQRNYKKHKNIME